MPLLATARAGWRGDQPKTEVYVASLGVGGIAESGRKIDNGRVDIAARTSALGVTDSGLVGSH